MDVADKIKGLLITKESKCTDENGELVSISTQSIFIKGLGGFGDKGTLRSTCPRKPQTKPDKIVIEKIPLNSAFLYRLTGDWNPLHVDPDIATLGGFYRPILHGLCTFGISGRIIYDAFCSDYENTTLD